MQKSGDTAAQAATTPARGRGRPRAFDREAALGQAMRLFWRKGFEATSMADLTATMGIGAPSLYAAFGSKESLYSEALCHYQKNFDHLVWGNFESAPTAREAVAALLMDSAAALTGCGSGLPSGCMVTLSAVDRERHAALCDSLRDTRGAARDRLLARFTRAVEKGELPSSTDLQALARFVQTVQSGMSILARDGVGRAELEAVARLAMQGWEAASR